VHGGPGPHAQAHTYKYQLSLRFPRREYYLLLSQTVGDAVWLEDSSDEPAYRQIARALIEAHGVRGAIAFAEHNSKAHVDTDEAEGATVWRRIAEAARTFVT